MPEATPDAENDVPERDHVVWSEPHGEQGPEWRCVCGWQKAHPRAKVRERAAAAHMTKHRPTSSEASTDA